MRFHAGSEARRKFHLRVFTMRTAQFIMLLFFRRKNLFVDRFQ